MPESHKHRQERPITNRSGQQCPCEIAAGGHATPEELSSAKTRARVAGRLTESHTRKPESELTEKLSKEETAFQNAVIKEILAEFGLEGVTKKRLGRYHREQRELGYADDWVPAEAGADCRDVRGEASLDIGGECSDGREMRGLLPAGGGFWVIWFRGGFGSCKSSSTKIGLEQIVFHHDSCNRANGMSSHVIYCPTADKRTDPTSG
uniref:Uncharacterized protein n=1 Tax=Candidatus Methanogaster sp. ANME-2c ERB4 TaxID=2759911 RepID=A0A7G9Y116_9EURY|nr:hypothetical protein NEBFCOPL_00001 [Methanosarcinales archaeon ANME-2c ERB4]